MGALISRLYYSKSPQIKTLKFILSDNDTWDPIIILILSSSPPNNSAMPYSPRSLGLVSWERALVSRSRLGLRRRSTSGSRGARHRIRRESRDPEEQIMAGEGRVAAGEESHRAVRAVSGEGVAFASGMGFIAAWRELPLVPEQEPRQREGRSCAPRKRAKHRLDPRRRASRWAHESAPPRSPRWREGRGGSRVPVRRREAASGGRPCGSVRAGGGNGRIGAEG